MLQLMIAEIQADNNGKGGILDDWVCEIHSIILSEERAIDMQPLAVTEAPRILGKHVVIMYLLQTLTDSWSS